MDEFNAFVESLSQTSLTGLRVNTLKISRTEFVQRSPFPLQSVPWCDCGFIVENEIVDSRYLSPGKHPYHFSGLYYLQEPSAMIAGEMLSPLPGEKVLDLAAAPGGKSTHLAALMQNSGFLVSNEIHPKRVWNLAENIERCGVTNSIILNETPKNLADYFGEYFDRVLVDAPCSGEGMFRKSDIARKEWSIDLPRGCAIRQVSILEHAARLVKLGGSLGYTTCTFSPEENEGVIASFLEKHPEFEIQAIDFTADLYPGRPEWINLPSEHKLNQSIRIWPHKSRGEGHFCAILYKNGMGVNSSQHRRYEFLPTPRVFNHPRRSNELKIFMDFAKNYLNHTFDENRIILKGNYIYQIPAGSPEIININVVHAGWWLGLVQNNRFIPSHALAMGIQIDKVKNVYKLFSGDLEINNYLRGENIYGEGEDGWVIVAVDNFPLGWGKRVNNMIKNHYPRGLRRMPSAII